MDWLLYSILCVLALTQTQNDDEKACLVITTFFLSSAPLIRKMFGVDGGDFFYYYAWVEVLYLFVVSKYWHNINNPNVLLWLSIVSCMYNVFEGSLYHHGVLSATYDYYKDINRILIDLTVFSIIVKPRVRFILGYIGVSYFWRDIYAFFSNV